MQFHNTFCRTCQLKFTGYAHKRYNAQCYTTNQRMLLCTFLFRGVIMANYPVTSSSATVRRCVREIIGAEAACFMGYDVTHAKLRQNVHCLEICVIFQFSANNNRNAPAAQKMLLSCFLFVKYMTIYSSNFVNFCKIMLVYQGCKRLKKKKIEKSRGIKKWSG